MSSHSNEHPVQSGTSKRQLLNVPQQAPLLPLLQHFHSCWCLQGFDYACIGGSGGHARVIMSTRPTISITSATQLVAEASPWIVTTACMSGCCPRHHAVNAGAVFVVCTIGAIYACPCRRTSRKDEVATEFNGLWKARVFLQVVGALWAVSIFCCAISDGGSIQPPCVRPGRPQHAEHLPWPCELLQSKSATALCSTES